MNIGDKVRVKTNRYLAQIGQIGTITETNDSLGYLVRNGYCTSYWYMKNEIEPICDICNGNNNNITPCPKCGMISDPIYE